MTTVYKVVRRSPRGKLYSAIVTHRSIRLKYPPGEVVHSPDGRRPLASATLEDAQSFATSHDLDIRHPSSNDTKEYGVEIWEAEATDVRPQHLVSPSWDTHPPLKAIKEFWASDAALESEWHKAGAVTGVAPPGTVSCKTIKLVRKVEV